MMRPRVASRQLATHAHARQVAVSRRADAAADVAGMAVRGAWRRLMALLLDPPALAEAHRQALALLAAILPAVRLRTAEALLRTARWGYRTAAAGVLDGVPLKWLARVANRRLREGRNETCHATGMGRRGAAGLLDTDSLLPAGARHGGGILVLQENEAGDSAFALDFDDLLSLLRPGAPATAPDDPLALIAALLFPPPSQSLIAHVVFGGDWQHRLAAGTCLGDPGMLANLVAQGLAVGRNPREIARDLLPHVQGVQASARRIARTESLRVAGAMQLHCHEQLGDLVIGYQVHSAFVPDTRPWHAKRSGTIYYEHPKPGQKGMAQCPHPPDEAADPGERPPGAPKTAWN